MTTATSSMGVVLALSDTTPVKGTFDDLPGCTVATLMIDLDEVSGLSLSFHSAVAVERVIDELRAVHHGFLAADRRRQEDHAWTQRRPDGPLLRVLAGVPAHVSRMHPSMLGPVR